jgi:hypothetical protein
MDIICVKFYKDDEKRRQKLSNVINNVNLSVLVKKERNVRTF